MKYYVTKSFLILMLGLFLCLFSNCKGAEPESDTTLTSDTKSLWVWGNNRSGEIGISTNIASAASRPQKIGTDADWAVIADNACMALKENGTLWAWGYNYKWGNNNTYIPLQIGTDSDWEKIACGNRFYAAIKKNGSLWMWGDNTYGQLGNSTIISSDLPTKIGNDYDWDRISCSVANTIALKKNGSLWMWGMIDALGNYEYPVQIGDETDWEDIASGQYSFYAIKKEGTLWAWGFNANCEYGNNNTIESSLPVKVGIDNDWKMVSKGYNHTMAIKNDGSLWAWGRNDFGQFGNGIANSIRQGSPIRVSLNYDWAYICCSSCFSVALKNDGTMWSWGENLNGVLGTGKYGSSNINEINNSFIPVNIGTGYKAVASTGSSCIAIKK